MYLGHNNQDCAHENILSLEHKSQVISGDMGSPQGMQRPRYDRRVDRLVMAKHSSIYHKQPGKVVAL